jgi:hypothetical protein
MLERNRLPHQICVSHYRFHPITCVHQLPVIVWPWKVERFSIKSHSMDNNPINIQLNVYFYFFFRSLFTAIDLLQMKFDDHCIKEQTDNPRAWYNVIVKNVFIYRRMNTATCLYSYYMPFINDQAFNRRRKICKSKWLERQSIKNKFYKPKLKT